MVKNMFSHHTRCNLRDLGGRENWAKMRSKWHQQIIKIEVLGVQCFIFWDLYVFGQACFFYPFSVGQKASPNHEQIDFWAAWWARERYFREPLIIQGGHLYWQILARLYILLSDNAGFWGDSKIVSFRTISKNDDQEQCLKKHETIMKKCC